MHWLENFRISFIRWENLYGSLLGEHIWKQIWFHTLNKWDDLLSFSKHTELHSESDPLVNDQESWAWMALWALQSLESKSFIFLDEYREKVKEI